MRGKNEGTSLDHALQEGQVAVHDIMGDHLPDLICHKRSDAVSLYLKKGKDYGLQANEFDVREYKSLSDIHHEYANVCFLDGEAIKLLLANYPHGASYVLVRIALRFSWLVALPGLIRRLAICQIRLRGMSSLNAGNKSQRWLVIEYLKPQPSGGSLSREIGIQGLLDYLREENVQYVVLRFFDKLPDLYRTHGDLDLLVADEDEEKVKKFLLSHPGPIPVDLRAMSSQYYPRPLAMKILKNAVDGPAGSRVPAPREAFLSFAYHALYHGGKGLFCGIPSRLTGVDVNPNPENDYAGILTQMAKNLRIQVSMEMESLDEYLHQEGWRPPQGNFTRLATGNEWIRRRFLSHRATAEVGLGVLILKEKALRLGLVDKIIEEIEREEFTLLRNKPFDEEGKRAAKSMLRGGDWRSSSGDEPHDCSPAMAVVILDTRPYAVFHAIRGANMNRIQLLKDKLRSIFDDEDTSMLHSTDNTSESWEYIEFCFPDEVDNIADMVDQFYLNFSAARWEKFRFYVGFVSHHVRHLRLRRLTIQIASALGRFLMK